MKSAGVQAELEEAGFDREAVKALVGHKRNDTMGRSYTGFHPLMPEMRRAVDSMGPVDWDGPDGAEGASEQQASNVVSFAASLGRTPQRA